MDELDLLKKDWRKQGAGYPTLSYDEIYAIIHKKSSSIVKWIFVIGMAEFIFWLLVNLSVPDRYFDIYEKFNLKTFLFITQIVHYAIVIIFIVLFYRNYKAISTIESTNELMKKILNSRKIVNYYVYYNILLYMILSVVINVIMFSQPDIFIEALSPKDIQMGNEQFLNVMLVAQIIAFFVMCGLLWGYYRIIYGILLKKLTKNYKELASLKV